MKNYYIKLLYVFAFIIGLNIKSNSQAIFYTSVTQSEEIQVNLGNDKEFCEGESTILDAGTGFESYQWSTNETSQTITVNVAGTYTITVTNSYNCSASDDITVSVNPLPVVNLGEDITQSDPVTLDAGEGYASYLWSNESTEQQITVTESGTYWVIVADENDCEGSDTINVQITTDINELFNDETNIQIIPNPNNGQFNLVTNKEIINGTIEVFNVYGQRICIENAYNITGDENIFDFSGNNPGLYFLKIAGNNFSIFKKFIIQ